jgi:hypothetical protein
MQTKWKYSFVNCVINNFYYCEKYKIALVQHYMSDVKLVAASSDVFSRKIKGHIIFFLHVGPTAAAEHIVVALRNHDR